MEQGGEKNVTGSFMVNVNDDGSFTVIPQPGETADEEGGTEPFEIPDAEALKEFFAGETPEGEGTGQDLGYVEGREEGHGEPPATPSMAGMGQPKKKPNPLQMFGNPNR